MISITKGDNVRIRDIIKSRESDAQVMAAGADVIITVDDRRLVERFDSEGWNPSRTRRITGKAG